MSPEKIIDDISISHISAFGIEGSFTILPGHIDLLSVLQRSIITVKKESGGSAVYAADGGLLTKEGETIRVSSPIIVKGRDISDDIPEEGISESINAAFRKLEEESSETRKQSVIIETDLVRKMVELRGKL